MLRGHGLHSFRWDEAASHMTSNGLFAPITSNNRRKKKKEKGITGRRRRNEKKTRFAAGTEWLNIELRNYSIVYSIALFNFRKGLERARHIIFGFPSVGLSPEADDNFIEN